GAGRGGARPPDAGGPVVPAVAAGRRPDPRGEPMSDPRVVPGEVRPRIGTGPRPGALPQPRRDPGGVRPRPRAGAARAGGTAGGGAGPARDEAAPGVHHQVRGAALVRPARDAARRPDRPAAGARARAAVVSPARSPGPAVGQQAAEQGAFSPGGTLVLGGVGGRPRGGGGAAALPLQWPVKGCPGPA